MVDIIKSIDGIYYVIYVIVLVFTIFTLIGYINARKTLKWDEENSKREKERLDYIRAKNNNEVMGAVPEVQKQTNSFVASTTPVAASTQTQQATAPVQTPNAQPAAGPVIPTVVTPGAQNVQPVVNTVPAANAQPSPQQTITAINQNPVTPGASITPNQVIEQKAPQLQQVVQSTPTIVINSQQPSSNGGNV